VAAAREVVIVGAGHNGLVTAFYLARAGLKPLVLERRPVVGGVAVTEEFHPGFRCPALLHSDGPLAGEIARDMQLERHGLERAGTDRGLFLPGRDGRGVYLDADVARAAENIARFSAKDAASYKEFVRVLGRLAEVLGPVLRMTPPSLEKTGAGDIWKLLRTARKVRGLGRQDMFRLLRWGPMAVADLAAELFETETLRAAVAARGCFGNFMGPWSAGSAAVLLLRAACDPQPAGSASAFRGGLGALTQAMAAAARQAGAEIRTDAGVERIVGNNGSVGGVVLKSGEEIAAKTVVSSADPKQTFLQLLEPAQLPPDFTFRLRNYRSVGTTAKVNLALAALPDVPALRESGERAEAALAGRIHIGPEIDYLERAFDAAKYGRFPEAPWLDVTLPTLSDPSLAPAGKHVLSVIVHHAPYALSGTDWNAQRDALGETVVRTLGGYAPDLPGKILSRQVLTPLDLEETFALTGGHLFHGELALDQLFTMRPLLEWARYRTPLRGLYLCGSGTHPGNGLTGLSGANAAREILKDLRS
jgi:phytoene dehydrogenase-like protein